jgi:hypothetical protein
MGYNTKSSIQSMNFLLTAINGITGREREEGKLAHNS